MATIGVKDRRPELGADPQNADAVRWAPLGNLIESREYSHEIITESDADKRAELCVAYAGEIIEQATELGFSQEEVLQAVEMAHKLFAERLRVLVSRRRLPKSVLPPRAEG